MIDPRILKQREAVVSRWQTLCRFASLADDTEQMEVTAQWLVSQLQPLFDTVGTIAVPGYGPVVYGIAPGEGDSTLMLYNHYDVQDIGDPNQWEHPPFDAQIRDGVMFARGACDDKADVAGRIDSFRLWKEEHDGSLPYTVVYFADPCEEIGSPGLETVLKDHADLFHADACLWESYLREEDGSPVIGYGCRGSLSVNIDLQVLRDGIHPSYGTIARSAPLELMKIVATLTTKDGLIAVPGMRELALKASDEAMRRLAKVRVPKESLRFSNTVSPNPAVNDLELSRRFVFEPAMSLVSFDLDENSARSIPPSCSATVRFSLVPGMTTQACFTLVERYVASLNRDARVSVVDSIEPAFSSPDSGFGRSVAQAASRSYGMDPVIYDVMTGSGPGAMFLEYLGAPIASATGTLRPDGNMHGYNEHGTVSDYLNHVDFTLNVLRRLEINGFGTQAD